MRLFAAVRPPGEVLAHLRAALTVAGSADVGTTGAGPIRWTAEENWHLTAAFYGEVPDGALGELEEALAGVARSWEPFTLRLRGAGVFSHRTLWVGAGEDVDRMAALAASARDAAEGIAPWQDDRPRHRPHLTVGRVAPAARRRPSRRTAPSDVRDPAAHLVHALSVYEGPAWRVAELVLVSSRPGEGRGGGPLYSDVGRYPLVGHVDDLDGSPGVDLR